MIPSRAIPLFLAALAAAACAGDPVNPEPVGDWGGRGASLRLTPDGGTVEFDCAHGRLDPFALDGDRFETSGTWVREGGPVRVDEEREAEAARYSGVFVGSRLVLSVTLDPTLILLGPYTLERGKPASIVKCL